MMIYDRANGSLGFSFQAWLTEKIVDWRSREVELMTGTQITALLTDHLGPKIEFFFAFNN